MLSSRGSRFRTANRAHRNGLAFLTRLGGAYVRTFHHSSGELCILVASFSGRLRCDLIRRSLRRCCCIWRCSGRVPDVVEFATADRSLRRSWGNRDCWFGLFSRFILRVRLRCERDCRDEYCGGYIDFSHCCFSLFLSIGCPPISVMLTPDLKRFCVKNIC